MGRGTRVAVVAAAVLGWVVLVAPIAQAGLGDKVPCATTGWQDLPSELQHACIRELPARDRAQVTQVDWATHARVGTVGSQQGVRAVSSQAELDALIANLGVTRIIHLHGNTTTTFRLAVNLPAQVHAHDPVQVIASGETKVFAYNWAQVTASGEAQVTAGDWAQITASDKAIVRASDWVQVYAFGAVVVDASNTVTVIASDKIAVHYAPGVRILGEATVTAYRK